MFRAFAFAALAGCGLDLAGQQFVGVGDSRHGAALSPPSVEAADASSLATRDGTGDGSAPDADPAFGQDASLAQSSAASPNPASPALDSATADANLPDADLPDAIAVQDGTRNDGAPDATDDAGTPCDRLTFCCKHLVAPLPSALLLCASAAQLADGGDAGACDSLLANLQGARFCP